MRPGRWGKDIAWPDQQVTGDGQWRRETSMIERQRFNVDGASTPKSSRLLAFDNPLCSLGE